jgi:putative sigma-54 modulation protein
MGKTTIRKTEEASDEQVFQKEKHIKLEPMTKDEALDQMELLGHDFFVYLDKETKKTNVIYLREDGEYAIIETE